MNLEKRYFNLLKKDLVTTLKKSFPEINEDIESWKGHEIGLFQEELIKKVNSRVSEKWFYTHIKGEQKDIPRIDMLNLLSQFTGYTNWTDYKSQNKISAFNPKIFANKWTSLAGLIVVSMASILIYSNFNTPKNYTFCFRDAYSNQPVSEDQLSIYMVSSKESPLRLESHKKCCYKIKSSNESVKLLPSSHYYKTDTIKRYLNHSDKSELILLQPNDFSIMLNLIANSDTSQWEKRKGMLIQSFTPSARIYEVNNNQLVGTELYNREEFVNKISLPIYSVKNMLIVDVQYEEEKIKLLRFKKKQR